MRLQTISPRHFPWFDYTRYTFSLGVAADSTAYLSGHSASEYDAKRRQFVVRGDMSQQTRTAYAKIEAILEGIGLGLSDVVRVVDYVTIKGVEDYDATAVIRNEVFGESQPAVNTVVVDRLLRPEALIEIEVVAS